MSDKPQTQPQGVELDVQALINAITEQRNIYANENAVLKAQVVTLATKLAALEAPKQDPQVEKA